MCEKKEFQTNNVVQLGTPLANDEWEDLDYMYNISKLYFKNGS